MTVAAADGAEDERSGDCGGQSLVDWTVVAAVDRRKEGGWMIYDSPLGEGETGWREGDRAREVKGEGIEGVAGEVDVAG